MSSFRQFLPTKKDWLLLGISAAFLACMAAIAMQNSSATAVIICIAASAFAIIAVQVLTYRQTSSQIQDRGAIAQAQTQSNYEQLEALLGIYQTLPIAEPLPPMGGFAASPDFAFLVVSNILEQKPGTIVELGSGVSTVVAGYALKRLGAGRIISFDHDEKYAAATRAKVRKHDLQEFVEVVTAPLVSLSVGAHHGQWYDPRAFEMISQIDLLVVDGPPAHLGPLSRYPALPLLWEKLSPGAVLLLDDASREDELRIGELWRAQFPDASYELLATKKGTLVLRRNTQTARTESAKNSLTSLEKR